MDIDLSVCYKKCEGLLVTSYIKKENNAELDEFAQKIMDEYTKFKKYVQFPRSIKGLLKI